MQKTTHSPDRDKGRSIHGDSPLGSYGSISPDRMPETASFSINTPTILGDIRKHAKTKRTFTRKPQTQEQLSGCFPELSSAFPHRKSGQSIPHRQASEGNLEPASSSSSSSSIDVEPVSPSGRSTARGREDSSRRDLSLQLSPASSDPADLIRSWLMKMFTQQVLPDLSSHPAQEEPLTIYRNIILPTILAESEQSAQESKKVRYLSTKRPVQYEKKFHSVVKSILKEGSSRQFGLPASLVHTKLREHLSLDGSPEDKEVFDNLFGKDSKFGLKKSSIDKVLTTRPLFDLFFNFKLFSNSIKRLNEQTIRDIETNIMRHVDEHFRAAPEDRRNFSIITQHVNKKRSFKKPFTKMENLLAPIYFLDRFIFRAKRKRSSNSQMEQVLHKLQKKKNKIEGKLVSFGFDSRTCSNTSKSKKKTAFLRCE